MHLIGDELQHLKQLQSALAADGVERKSRIHYGCKKCRYHSTDSRSAFTLSGRLPNSSFVRDQHQFAHRCGRPGPRRRGHRRSQEGDARAHERRARYPHISLHLVLACRTSTCRGGAACHAAGRDLPALLSHRCAAAVHQTLTGKVVCRLSTQWIHTVEQQHPPESLAGTAPRCAPARVHRRPAPLDAERATRRHGSPHRRPWWVEHTRARVYSKARVRSRYYDTALYSRAFRRAVFYRVPERQRIMPAASPTCGSEGSP